ncbi:MAG: patatin-like phospholipase family protein [Pseudomonadota bacterium]
MGSARPEGSFVTAHGNTAKPILGLVLSGGGARGIAHIGVIKALQERGIVPDMIAGSSSGAIVGALAAAGHSTETMLEFFRTRSPFRLKMVTVRKAGIIDTVKVVESLREYFPEDSFEALDTRLYLTATEIARGRLTIFESGPLTPAILASCSIPMVFTPTTIAGRQYVDGGVINNFPVEPLRGHCDVIVGHYASPLRAVQAADVDGALAVSQRALEIAMYFSSRRKFYQCDVMICPPRLSDFGLFDMKNHQEIFETGYEATLGQLDEIEQALAGA